MVRAGGGGANVHILKIMSDCRKILSWLKLSLVNIIFVHTLRFSGAKGVTHSLSCPLQNYSLFSAPEVIAMGLDLDKVS